NQPSNLTHYTIFLPDLPSTSNHPLLTHYIHKHFHHQPPLFLLNQQLQPFTPTLFPQTIFPQFQHKIHQIQQPRHPLTPNPINQQYAKLNKFYFPQPVQTHEHITKQSSPIPHFYINYYVYQYATPYTPPQTLTH
ncbi:M3 family metallopeptidase, partial [Staphylococcus epidermidis]|uniref:M3 family metallopeptidase n=1 Tax=Staphylococcus epidermidis TaxID=1282 RepID=UPI0011A53E9A